MPGSSVLSGSVGAGGANQAPDVGLVQLLLNEVRGLQRKPLLAVDGIVGPLTIAAIRDYQQQFHTVVDGRVDASGATIKSLIFAYTASLRLGVQPMRAFPPAFAALAAQERPGTTALGDTLRDALTEVKRGIAPLLKAQPAKPPQPPQPRPRPPSPPTDVA